jgi:hypothetical protein
MLVNNLIDADSKDQRIFPWGSGSYAPSKFYKFYFAILPSDNTCKAISKSRMLPKLKVFCWLLFHDRLNTLDIMDRKQWNVENGFDSSRILVAKHEFIGPCFMESLLMGPGIFGK